MLGKMEGIVLRTNDYGEGNKIVTIFTNDVGKIGVMARGARKTKSRFSAVAQPFIHALFFLRMSRTGMASLNQADLLQSFSKVKADLYKTAYVSYIAELVDRLTEDRVSNPVLFRMILESFKHIENGKDYEIVARIFEIKILSMYGFKPVLQHCALCHKGSEPWFFSVQEGGLVCGSCTTRDSYAFLLPGTIPRILYLFQGMDIKQLGDINIKDETKAILKRVTQEFIDTHVGVRLKTRRFLDQLDQIEQYIPRVAHEEDKKNGKTGFKEDL